MSEPARLELSAMGAVRPPAEGAVAAARRRESQGFDAIWWADHLLHWFPHSIWTPDLVPQAAAGQRSPHVWFDPVPVVAAAAGATSGIRLGIGVTDLVRRHPVAVAQTALTLDHLSGGRFLLGVGSGEALNLAPFGIENRRPLARLDEGLALMRALMETTDPIDFHGDHFTVTGGCLGLEPLPSGPPPIWVAAHRPKGLALTGRRADGWLPLATDPGDYAAMLARVRAAAAEAGRQEGAVTPGLYARIVVAETAEEAVAAIDGSLLMRFIALTRPAEAYHAHGAEHPLGPGAFGLTSFLPTGYGRAEALALAEAVPLPVLRETVIHGTPDDIAAAVRRFADAGARHVQLTNMTPLAAPAMAAASEALLGDAVAAIRAGDAAPA
jgi:phthiodiolone/phenolphthiodiolone dimycocerosates ketoreductase